MSVEETVRFPRKQTPGATSAEREKAVKTPRYPLMEEILERPYREYGERWRQREAA